MSGNITEVRSPRYFDLGDTLGYQKTKETSTYTGRNLVAKHSEAPDTTEAVDDHLLTMANPVNLKRQNPWPSHDLF